MGTRRLNFLTDDPWNRWHRAPWFMNALRAYDQVLSPRRANIEDLRRHGCASVAYLPFAYSPRIHFPEALVTPDEHRDFAADVTFAGGADAERRRVVAALIREGFSVSLYGQYWNWYPETRRFARGHANPATLRRAVAGAKVALSLVRRANRDGHAMRTFELGAMGACMLAEDSEEHRQILGSDGESVLYFRSEEEMIDRMHWLVEHEGERRRLRAAVHARITGGGNTYADRLSAMLSVAQAA
jgi:spore maturation protein CgeB